MTRSCAGIISSRSVRSSPIRCISPHPHGQSRLSGSITFSIRGRSLGRLPRLRRAGLRGAGPVDVCVFCCVSTSATAVSRSSKASCRSSSLSFSDLLPCTTWFSSATRCSRRLLASRSASRSRSTARTASRWSSGMAERSMVGVLDMSGAYPGLPLWTQAFGCPSHSATAGRRASRDRTRRQSSPANSASNWARFSVIAPSRMAGQVKLFSSSRL